MRRVLFLLVGAAALVTPALAQAPVADPLAAARGQAAEAARRLAGIEDARRSARDEAARVRLDRAAAAAGIEEAEARVAAATLSLQRADARQKAEEDRLRARSAPASALVAALVALERRPPLAALVEDGGRADRLVRIEALLGAALPKLRAHSRDLAERLARARGARAAAVEARAQAGQARETLAKRRDAFLLIERKAEARAALLDETLFDARGAAILSEAALADMDDAAAAARRAEAEGQKIAALPLSGPSPFAAEAGEGQARRRAPPGYRLPALAPVDEGLGAVSSAGIRSRGVRLRTARGERLVAPAAGEILFAGPFRGHDGLIAIDHGGGWISLIVDASPDVKRGQAVRAGDAIGRALGPIRVELRRGPTDHSAALIAGSSAEVSNSLGRR